MMESSNVIEIEDLWKSYMIVDEDRFDRSRLHQKRIIRPTKEYHVLRGINLAVGPGEVVGILGKNGSGKSTLQKIISRVIKPSSGEVRIRGKVASILELSMGFIPDMTGYENIFLRAELYGMRRTEIMKYVDDIVRFADIGEFMCNPVRTYSSGMRARLAFSILTVIDADIFVFDEALGTGDITFGNQSSEFIRNQIVKKKTVIFTSHNLRSIQNLCTRVIWIKDGAVAIDSDPLTAISAYRRHMLESNEGIESMAKVGVADAEYKLAMRNLWSGNESEYERLIRSAAKHGNPIAQVYCGDEALKSSGFKDTDTSLEMYTLSAEKGNLDARKKYSMIYGENLDFVLNIRSLLEQLSASGDPYYKYQYGKVLLSTSWSIEDREVAFNIFLEAANNGNIDAKYQVALMHRDGIGTEISIDKAVEILSDLGENGHYKSQEVLAEIYYNGILIERDVARALYWYTKSAMHGNQKSQYIVASMYRDGIGTEVNEDVAKKWFRRYVGSSMVNEVISLGHLLSMKEAGSHRDLDTNLTSKQMFSFAAETFNSRAIRFIGSDESILKELEGSPILSKINAIAEKDSMTKITAANNYYKGIGMERDFKKAFQLYSELSDAGNAQAMFLLADFYKEGIVVEKDLNRYRDLVFQSAERGYRSAIIRVNKWKQRNARRKRARNKNSPD